MSEILEIVKRRTHKAQATYRVRCAACGRIYLSNVMPSRIQRAKECDVCKRVDSRPAKIKTQVRARDLRGLVGEDDCARFENRDYQQKGVEWLRERGTKSQFTTSRYRR